MTDQPERPVEASCDRCKQTRPLFLYQPDHNMHAIPVPCEWCDRDTQPLLCSRCWGVERERELNAPMSADEQAATEFLLGLAANTGRLIRQAEADRAECEAIAAVSTTRED
ncbi:hypothetical protein [Kitasatospora sp. NPDC001175]|uniref:hypothetical protein n=1 Tax=Kitasatospora sp. NPDC001175 TaxID=3157103 RepID=UPI003D0368FA